MFTPNAYIPQTDSDIVLADRLTDAHQVRLRGVSNLAVSWELSKAGQLSFELPYVDLLSYGLADLPALKGKWIHYEHPTAGPWGGIVRVINASNGVVSLGAESWAVALDGVGTRVFGQQNYAMLSMLMKQINAVRQLTGIRAGGYDVGSDGDLVAQDETLDVGTDLYQTYLPAILSRWQDERGWKAGLQSAAWNIDPTTRVLNFDSTYGTDKSHTVWIHAGRHITSTDIQDDLEDVINTVNYAGKVNYTSHETITKRTKKGKKKVKRITVRGTKPAFRTGRNTRSVTAFGERSLTLEKDFSSETLMQQAATNRAQFMALDTQNVSIQIADVDQVWSTFREGDLVMLAAGFDGLIGKMVIRNRALNVAQGVMTVAGEAALARFLV